MHISPNEILTLDELKQFRNNTSCKYTSAGGYTTSSIQSVTAPIHMSRSVKDTSLNYIFHGQISIEDELFSFPGDGGAFCFVVVEKYNKLMLKPFAMIIGRVMANRTIATPLEDVFKKLGLDMVTMNLFPVHDKIKGKTFILYNIMY